MVHSRSHSQRAVLDLERVLSLTVCALLGAVAILLWWQDLLRFLLATKFHLPVLWCGIGLVVLVVLGGIGLALEWRNQHHCDRCHDHGQGEDHGTRPWRYVVLMLPVTLYFLGFPNAGLTLRAGPALDLEEAPGTFAENTGLRIIHDETKDAIRVIGVTRDSASANAGIKIGDSIPRIIEIQDADGKPLAKAATISTERLSAQQAAKAIAGKPQTAIKLTIRHEDAENAQDVVVERSREIMSLGFLQIDKGTYIPRLRDHLDGRMVRIKGEFVPTFDRHKFGLCRAVRKCCTADVIFIKAEIRLDQGKLEPMDPKTWIEVTGRVEYLKLRGKDDYAAVLHVAQPGDIVTIPPDHSPFIDQ